MICSPHNPAQPATAGFFTPKISRRALVSTAVLGLLAGCGGGGGEAPAAHAGAPATTVEIYGDSIVRGPGLAAPIAQALRTLRPAWEIDDRSANGLRLADLVDGYTEPYASAPPDDFPRGPQPAFAAVQRAARVVVLALGANDAPGGRPPAAFERDLREAVRIVRAEGRVPVLTGVVGFPPSAAFQEPWVVHAAALNAITLSVAHDLGLQHAGWGEDYRGPEDLIDSVHRSQAASDRLAARLAAAIERATP